MNETLLQEENELLQIIARDAMQSRIPFQSRRYEKIYLLAQQVKKAREIISTKQ